MNILHIAYSDLAGGASIGTYELHKEMLLYGINSKLLVINKKTVTDDSIITINNKYFFFIRMKISRFLGRRLIHNNEFHSLNIFRNKKLVKFINKSNYDIINLHWIGNEVLSAKDIKKIKKKIVWTVRDEWPSLAVLHYSNDRKSLKTLEKILLFYKKNISNINALVGLSSWVLSEIGIYKEAKREVIPNLVDLNLFRPINRNCSKEILGINRNKKVICFGAINPFADRRKGFLELKKTLEIYFSNNNKDEYLLLTFGDESKNYIIEGLEHKNIGIINNRKFLPLLYSAADVFIMSSLKESFGKTITESLACGTPVLAFDVAGQREIIRHKLDGYKARPYDIGDMVFGLTWILHHKFNIEDIRENLKSKYSGEIIVKKYLQLYKDLLDE